MVAEAPPGHHTLREGNRHERLIHFSEAMRSDMGIPDGFVRISVGLESAEDLKEDFERALEGLR
jgi:cystathionine beta-lyase/cystathionine gamma-synthase